MNRLEMQEAIANSEGIPGWIKASAFIYLNTMSDEKMQEIGDAAGACMSAIKEGDYEGMAPILAAAGVPDEVVNFIISFATRSAEAD